MSRITENTLELLEATTVDVEKMMAKNTEKYGPDFESQLHAYLAKGDTD